MTMDECVGIKLREFDLPQNTPLLDKSEFRRKRDTGIWHWKPECPGWPGNDYFTKKSRPDWTQGRLCPKCKKLDNWVTREENPVGA